MTRILIFNYLTNRWGNDEAYINGIINFSVGNYIAGATVEGGRLRDAYSNY